MMRNKFSKHERYAGSFVLISLFVFVVFVVSAAVKQGWFETTVTLWSQFKNAEGIRPGTPVQLSGIKVGQVTTVEILNSSQVKVRYEVQEKYLKSIKSDSAACLVRPFILSERILDISVGTEGQGDVIAGGEIASHETIDLMSLLSGKELSDRWSNITEMGIELKPLVHQIVPLLRNLNEAVPQITNLTKDVNQKNKLSSLMNNFEQVSRSMARILNEFEPDSGTTFTDLKEMISNMTVISRDLKQTLPALQAVTPDLPKAGLRAIEALDQAVILLKAMQKSIFMRSNVKEVLEEEQSVGKKRLPSQE